MQGLPEASPPRPKKLAGDGKGSKDDAAGALMGVSAAMAGLMWMVFELYQEYQRLREEMGSKAAVPATLVRPATEAGSKERDAEFETPEELKHAEARC